MVKFNEILRFVGDPTSHPVYKPANPSDVAGLVTKFTELRISSIYQQLESTSDSHLQEILTLNLETLSSSSFHPSPSKAEFPIDSAKALVIVETSIGVVKRFRKLTAGKYTSERHFKLTWTLQYTLIQNRLENS